MQAMSYVRPRCGAVTYGSHVADSNVQVFEHYDSSLVCPRNFLICYCWFHLRRSIGRPDTDFRRAFKRCSRRLCQLESQDTAKIRQGFPGDLTVIL